MGLGIENKKVEIVNTENAVISLENCEQRTIEDGVAVLAYAVVRKKADFFRFPSVKDFKRKSDFYRDFLAITGIDSVDRINNTRRLLVECGCLEKYLRDGWEHSWDYVFTGSFLKHLSAMSFVKINDGDGRKNLFKRTDKEAVYSRLLILLSEKLRVGLLKKDVNEVKVEARGRKQETRAELREKLEEVEFCLSQSKEEIELLKAANQKLKVEKEQLLKDNRVLEAQSQLSVNKIEIGKHREIVLAVENENKKKDREIALLKNHIRLIETRKFGDRNDQFGNWDAIEDPEERLMKDWPTGKKKE
ncbi:hypothetical protein KJ855_03880 [Patescibacteria group bacterium]|nr:hypothetical protein [Patescibacteria group bacterium]